MSTVPCMFMSHAYSGFIIYFSFQHQMYWLYHWKLSVLSSSWTEPPTVHLKEIDRDRDREREEEKRREKRKKGSTYVFVLFRWLLLGVANYFPVPLILSFFLSLQSFFKPLTNTPVTLINLMGIWNWSPLFFSLLHIQYSLLSDCIICQLFPPSLSLWL